MPKITPDAIICGMLCPVAPTMVPMKEMNEPVSMKYRRPKMSASRPPTDTTMAAHKVQLMVIQG